MAPKATITSKATTANAAGSLRWSEHPRQPAARLAGPSAKLHGRALTPPR